MNMTILLMLEAPTESVQVEEQSKERKSMLFKNKLLT
jgi:hypothetical protein